MIVSHFFLTSFQVVSCLYHIHCQYCLVLLLLGYYLDRHCRLCLCATPLWVSCLSWDISLISVQVDHNSNISSSVQSWSHYLFLHPYQCLFACSFHLVWSCSSSVNLNTFGLVIAKLSPLLTRNHAPANPVVSTGCQQQRLFHCIGCQNWTWMLYSYYVWSIRAHFG